MLREVPNRQGVQKKIDTQSAAPPRRNGASLPRADDTRDTRTARLPRTWFRARLPDIFSSSFLLFTI
jgi:hypothetical protein